MVRQAVKKLKNNQAPGFDEMSAALLKADPETTTDLLVCLFEHMQEEKMPTDWQKGFIVTVAMQER